MEIQKKKKRRFGIFKIIILIIILSALFGWSIVGIATVFKSQEKVLKLGLEDVGELVTQTCHTVVLEDTKENLSFFSLFDIPFTESRQIFSYDFDVDASIDFSKIEISKIDNKNKEVLIKIPHADVYKVVLNPDTFKSYLDSKGLFSRIDLSEHNEALLKMEDAAKAQCLASNFLERADNNAQKLLSVMVKSEDGFKNYNVIFEYYPDETENISDKTTALEDKKEEKLKKADEK